MNAATRWTPITDHPTAYGCGIVTPPTPPAPEPIPEPDPPGYDEESAPAY